MKRSTPERRSLPAFWVVLGVAVLATAGMLLVLISLAAEPGGPAPASLTAQPSPIEALPISPTGQLAATPVMDLFTPTPAPRPEVPEVAPDLALERAGGGSFSLHRQLEEGPVVLVFFERCG